MIKNFLIVGGTGFLGRSLIEKLVKNKKNLITCIYSSNKKFKKIKKVKYLKCDISKFKNLKKIKSNYDYVVNFAGYVDHKNKIKTILSHYTGCKNLADFFVRKKIKLFIQIGSSLEYGKKNSPHKESLTNKICEMKSYYSKSKLKATNYLNNLSKKKKLKVCVIRPYLIYGPKQDFNRFLPIVIRAALEKKEFNCSDGKQYRDFLYISDFINLILRILNSKNITYKIYNAGSGKAVKLMNVIKSVISLAKGGVPKFGVIKIRKDEQNKSYACLKKVKNELNWKPKVPFYSGLLKTFNYYKKYAK